MFPLARLVHGLIFLIVDEQRNPIGIGEPRDNLPLVLGEAPHEIARHPDVEDATPSVGEDVDKVATVHHHSFVPGAVQRGHDRD
jgi:hypothetical protein